MVRGAVVGRVGAGPSTGSCTGGAGGPWRDLPERFGKWKTVCERHGRWSADHAWGKIPRPSWPTPTWRAEATGQRRRGAIGPPRTAGGSHIALAGLDADRAWLDLQRQRYAVGLRTTR
ncbi:transposase [Streptomyces sp. NPDC101227]|uniref:transposase n=1 Tax=Streptomyces sp. NPDC101227 TaxID=3366136 RepID=UPI00380C2D92